MNCLSFNPYSEFILATGSADKVKNICWIFIQENTSSPKNVAWNDQCSCIVNKECMPNEASRWEYPNGCAQSGLNTMLIKKHAQQQLVSAGCVSTWWKPRVIQDFFVMYICNQLIIFPETNMTLASARNYWTVESFSPLCVTQSTVHTFSLICLQHICTWLNDVSMSSLFVLLDCCIMGFKESQT